MRIFRVIVINTAVLAAVLIVIEGVASYVSFIRGYATAPDLAERRHTRYDALLGWVNVPNADIPDMYGPGVRLRINSQGFRNDRDFEPVVPAGKLRVICSGDSFTLGYGVDNDHPWCERLSKLNPRLETVNMGQGGYGADQAYLWYKRDGTLPHQVQIFAFISDDLPRVSADAFSGYAKPVLKIDGDSLRVTNVPVPGSTARRFLERAQELRTVTVLRRLIRRVGVNANTDLSLEETNRVIAKMLADLKRLNDERSSRLILVYLPTELDLLQPDTEWLPPVVRAAQALNIPFVDLTSDFRAVPPVELAALFIRQGQLDYPGSAGHYTVAGNELVAHAMLEKIAPYLPQ
jgi:hypothetical protein